MIISASYKTDIPAFYGTWFMRRLDAGYCKMVNPFNRHVVRVSLTRDEVDGFVFWTKNVAPFMRHLPEVRQRGYPFVLQYTINGYPRSLEFSVVDARKSVEHFRAICEQFGPKVCVWRYDTIIFSSLSPPDYHLRAFERLAKALSGATDEVVISFAQIYRKTRRNMNWAASKFGFDWCDPTSEEKRKLAAALVQIADSYKMQLSVCSQRDLLVPGARDARCVDAARLELVGGGEVVARLRGNREDCGCYESRDIGEYDTCPHGCVYCYAVQNRKLAQDRYRAHDETSEFLFAPFEDAIEPPPERTVSLPLFPSDQHGQPDS